MLCGPYLGSIITRPMARELQVINGLARLGATVVHKETAKVHVSGHAPAGELRTLLNVAKPRYLMPVHGEWRHLRAHAQLGIETGVAPDRVVLCEDGDVVDLVEGHARVVGRVRSRYVYVDGLAVGDVSESLLTERRILGDGGFISATVVIDSVTGKVVGEPSISAKGFSEDPQAFDPVIPLLTAALHRDGEDLSGRWTYSRDLYRTGLTDINGWVAKSRMQRFRDIDIAASERRGGTIFQPWKPSSTSRQAV